MIRNLRFTDLPAQLLPGRLGGADLAQTRGDLGGGVHRLNPLDIARWSLSASNEQHPLALVRGGRLEAVALLHVRHGRRAWEVAHLFAADIDSVEILSLLEQAVAYVGSRGGERLFLRVPYRTPIQEVAQRAGFFPAFTEEAFTLNRPMSTQQHTPALELRPPLPADTHSLFRLYNAALPSSVRSAAGLTLDQWQDAREDARGVAREYVWENGGQVRGWVRLDQKGGTLTIDALLHPDEGAAASLLVGHVAHLARSHRRSIWVVPKFQPAVSSALHHWGWEPCNTHAVLIRSAAVRIEEPSLMPVQA